MRLVPPMLVFLANEFTRGIPMVLAHVKSIHASNIAVDERIGQSTGERVVATLQDKRIPFVGFNVRSKLESRRMILILAPNNVPIDTFALVGDDLLELSLFDHSVALKKTDS